MKRRVAIIGATGSIGTQALVVIKDWRDYFEVTALSAHRDEEALLAAAAAFPGATLCLSGAAPASDAIKHSGVEGLDRLIRDGSADVVLNAAAGSGGLIPSMAAVETGKDLALANKESVVMAWGVLSVSAARSGSNILPVDSEHAGLFQLISGLGIEKIEELVITASGGPFRDTPLDELITVTADEAAAHPNWSMGRKISIDSATMANKGLEVIEAARLFGFNADRIKVLIHPQSLVHALVRVRDGSLHAQISEPDMRVPIQNALTWPQSLPCRFGRLDLAGRELDFQLPDPLRYPLLNAAYQALSLGEGSTIAYNAADEVAVEAFEAGRIRFTEIAQTVIDTISRAWPSALPDLDCIFEVDRKAREIAAMIIRERQ